MTFAPLTSMHRRRLLRLAGTAIAVSGAGCLSAGGSGKPRRVSMTEDFGYDPERLRVDAGTTVRWVNDSDVGHTVTAYEAEIPEGAAYFASGGFGTERAARNDAGGGLLDAGGSYEHTFEVGGAYGYFCVPHESSGMTGTVVVR
jgi:plastocyanin